MNDSTSTTSSNNDSTGATSSNNDPTTATSSNNDSTGATSSSNDPTTATSSNNDSTTGSSSNDDTTTASSPNNDPTAETSPNSDDATTASNSNNDPTTETSPNSGDATTASSSNNDPTTETSPNADSATSPDNDPTAETSSNDDGATTTSLGDKVYTEYGEVLTDVGYTPKDKEAAMRKTYIFTDKGVSPAPDIKPVRYIVTDFGVTLTDLKKMEDISGYYDTVHLLRTLKLMPPLQDAQLIDRIKLLDIADIKIEIRLAMGPEEVAADQSLITSYVTVTTDNTSGNVVLAGNVVGNLKNT